MASPPTHQLGLSDFPVELLEMICQYLCLHCQCPHVVDEPTEKVVAWYQGQKALARLSRTCRLLCLVAQPILFHWYHAVDGCDEIPEFQRLSAFVLATLHHPEQLGMAVKSLALHPPAHDKDTYKSREMTKVRIALKSDAAYRRTVESLGGYLLTSHVLDTVHLQELALAYLPNVSELSLLRDLRCWTTEFQGTNIILSQIDQLRKWTYHLPALRYLVFPCRRGKLIEDGVVDSFHIHLADILLSRAPNLETLIVADGSGWPCTCMRAIFQKTPWDTCLLRLLRLSISNIGVQELERIVAGCPALEDIEFFDAANLKPAHYCPLSERTYEMNSGVLEPAKHLGGVRTTLKRLCYSVLDGRLCIGTTSSTFHLYQGKNYFTRTACPRGLAEGLSFAEFPALERLEVEESILYGRVLADALDSGGATPDDLALQLTTPEAILERLPPSLLHLRLGCVVSWPVVLRDMVALSHTGLGGQRYCPQLETVDLEVFVAPPDTEHRFLVEIMAARGVRVSVSYVSCWEATRGMLPPRPGAPRVIPYPVQLGADGE
ncbi:hypothetical protein QBC39DRAFT_302331 [Podospora conica]|nr:hypothetical protein QBC39DRAFT_302331 [Schizothecium conicum]